MRGADRVLEDEAATLRLGTRLAGALEPGTVIHLRGDLGAGKTTLVRGLLRGLGFGGRVKSPTFSLVELYELSKLSLYHFDFYRFDDPRDWQDAGLADCFDGIHVCCVEWPEKAGADLPAADVRVHLEPMLNNGRQARIDALTSKGERCIAGLHND